MWSGVPRGKGGRRHHRPYSSEQGSAREVRAIVGSASPGRGYALGFFCRTAKETNEVLVRAFANKRGYICEAAHILFTPYAPNVEGSALPNVPPDSMAIVLGATRAPSLVAKGASGVGCSFLRVDR